MSAAWRMIVMLRSSLWGWTAGAVRRRTLVWAVSLVLIVEESDAFAPLLAFLGYLGLRLRNEDIQAAAEACSSGIAATVPIQ